ncbi:MAG: DUF4350 domain-containing protein [Flavobacteriaceae bacterium CG_4_8_14_3_um_filter_34_10]|nr:DUF4350 domain-containing protein [Flavobacteriia bacterium]OIP50182.1 MAG: hypothetical protein AUK33_08535 [Flavobacteriaceae bacterium CG2_30_34_30]PIQ19019.1 MAG: hypothetical protein COW66_03350 [Flavobacteriaceae bacterium CG18_big_fil_WC_8_21_14_2_50_34_36]PIX09447.1 MAG: DUF4350 domain-containing protein [Flavobacteriaceae bacterium CG_4_8_14_3_um_filter_34_10]
MTKIQKILTLGFLITIAALVYVESTKPVPLSWFPSYSNEDKIPYGSYVLFDLLQDTFKNKLEEVNLPPFEMLKDTSFYGTYLFINNTVNFDKSELEKLLAWTEKGNTLFVSANYHSEALLDSLKMKTSAAFLFSNFETRALLNLVNKKLTSSTPFLLNKEVPILYFKEIDTAKTTVLGVTQVFNDTLTISKPKVNFIRMPIGKGLLYLHNQPEIFTNYFILTENNIEHTQNVLSYLNNNTTIYWDNHYKTGKKTSKSPLYLLFANKHLKWGYYFVLLGSILFILFEGKRKQKPIPIVVPLTNKTYEYTQTIAGMYLEKKEHLEIAKKQIALFFEFIRTRLRLPTEHINQRFFEALASRSNSSVEDVKSIFLSIENIQKKPTISKEELLVLYQKINHFKTKVDGTSTNK